MRQHLTWPVSVRIVMQEGPLAEVASLQAQRRFLRKAEDPYERQTIAYYSHGSGNDGGGEVSGH